MEKRNLLKNQKGFTLIEIIAVLVILGILAAVAVPKFVDLQTESKERAVLGALAAVKSQAVMDYSDNLLKGTATGSSWTSFRAAGMYGDFSGVYANDGGVVSVTVLGDANYGTDWLGSARTASFNIW